LAFAVFVEDVDAVVVVFTGFDGLLEAFGPDDGLGAFADCACDALVVFSVGFARAGAAASDNAIKLNPNVLEIEGINDPPVKQILEQNRYPARKVHGRPYLAGKPELTKIEGRRIGQERPALVARVTRSASRREAASEAGQPRHLHHLIEEIFDLDAIAGLERFGDEGFGADAGGVELFGGIVDVRVNDFPRLLTVHADALDPFENGVASTFEHRVVITESERDAIIHA